MPRSSGALEPVRLRSHLCDDSSSRPCRERYITGLAARRETRVVIALVGVQTSHRPRAIDLARRFHERRRRPDRRLPCVGQHCAWRDLPEHLRELANDGVTLVVGEVEDTWLQILKDAAAGSLAPLYDVSHDLPDLREAPVPRLDVRTLRHFACGPFGTLDAGRGCPFACSFCTIINVPGRKMRHREPSTIAGAIACNYRELGTHHYFFTDDNFSRHPELACSTG